MVTCKKCGVKNLCWKKQDGKSVLCYVGGLTHICTSSRESLDTYLQQKESKNPFLCRHLIKKGGYCQKCIEEERELIKIESETGVYRK